MFTLTPENLRHLAKYHETLGGIIYALALPGDFDDNFFGFKPINGWIETSVSPAAQKRYGDLPLRTLTDPSGSIILTLAKEDVVHLYAEGEGWAIEADEIFSGWEDAGFYADEKGSGATSCRYAI